MLPSAASPPRLDQLSDHLVTPLLVLARGDEEEFRDLVDEDHDRGGSFVVRRTPYVRGDLLVRDAGRHALPGPDEVVPVLHLLYEYGQQLGSLIRVRGQRQEPRREGSELHTALEVDADERHGLSRQLRQQVAKEHGLPRERGSEASW